MLLAGGSDAALVQSCHSKFLLGLKGSQTVRLPMPGRKDLRASVVNSGSAEKTTVWQKARWVPMPR